jgi:hypothetical protein
VSSRLVVPHTLDLPLSEDLSALLPRPSGLLRVEVVRAAGLPAADLAGLLGPQPYCQGMSNMPNGLPIQQH